MSGRARGRTRDGTPSGGQEQERDIVYIISVLVHEIEHMLLQLDGRHRID